MSGRVLMTELMPSLDSVALSHMYEYPMSESERSS